MKKNVPVTTNKDDNLFGLLLSYKSNNTYIRVVINEDNQTIELFITDNPKNWKNLHDAKIKKIKILRRLEVGVNFLFIKYISPLHLIKSLGPLLGFNLPLDAVAVLDQLEEKGVYCISTQLKYKFRVLQGVRKLINLKPHKKYELLEKSIVIDQEESNDRTV